MTRKNEPPSDLYRNALAYHQADQPIHRRREAGQADKPHKFVLGQSLFFSPSPQETSLGQGTFRVIGLLPAAAGEKQYRLKIEADGHERVVRESQLALL